MFPSHNSFLLPDMAWEQRGDRQEDSQTPRVNNCCPSSTQRLTPCRRPSRPQDNELGRVNCMLVGRLIPSVSRHFHSSNQQSIHYRRQLGLPHIGMEQECCKVVGRSLLQGYSNHRSNIQQLTRYHRPFVLPRTVKVEEYGKEAGRSLPREYSDLRSNIQQ